MSYKNVSLSVKSYFFLAYPDWGYKDGLDCDKWEMKSLVVQICLRGESMNFVTNSETTKKYDTYKLSIKRESDYYPDNPMMIDLDEYGDKIDCSETLIIPISHGFHCIYFYRGGRQRGTRLY